MEVINLNSNCFVTESVSEGHPDKLCDQIAQKILDYCLDQDSNTRLACEVFVTAKKLIIGGEIRANFLNTTNGIARMNYKNFEKQVCKLARKVIDNDVGYTNVSWENLDQLEIDVLFNDQSVEIQKQIESNHTYKLGDNTIVFGYACTKNSINYFPKGQTFANRIMQKLNQIRKNTSLNRKWQLAPDGKVEVFGCDNVIHRIHLCQQFLYPEEKFVDFQNDRQDLLLKKVILPLMEECGFHPAPKSDFQWKVQPFHIGGPVADTGLTGRKIIVDSYGVFAKHGGGSYIGKDFTKGDTSLALYARLIAKHLVIAKIVPQIQIQISAVIGSSKIQITSNAPADKQPIVEKILNKFFQLNFSQIIHKLNSPKTSFFPFASYGFFGRKDHQASWEKIDNRIISQIQKFAKNQ